MQVPYAQQLRAFSGLLDGTLGSSGGRPEEALPVLATALVAQELRQRRSDDPSDDSSASLQRIIETGLKQLQAWLTARLTITDACVLHRQSGPGEA